MRQEIERPEPRTCSRQIPVRGMRQRLMMLSFIATLLWPLGGCRICSTCDMESYSAYGGAWERTRRDGGRVGSIFDPAGTKLASLAARDTPPSAEELERQRKSDADPDDADLRDRRERERMEQEEAEEGDETERSRQKEREERRRRFEEQRKQFEDLDFDDLDAGESDGIDAGDLDAGDVSVSLVPAKLLNLN